jgi:tetratricopeptide (TPR) repeat protein
MKPLQQTIIVMALLLGWGAPLAGVAQTAVPATAAPAASTGPKPVQAKLVLGKDEKEVDLVGREKNSLFYRPRGGPEGASMTVKLEEITEGEFVVELDGEAVSKALMAENWPAAAVLLTPVATPLLPYLDIPENNGVPIAIQAGQALMKSARNLMVTGGANLERATNVYLRAHQVLKAVSTAEWTPDAEVARLNAIQCLIAVGDLKTAAKDLAAARAPDPGDESFGLYWLAQAQLHYARGQTRAAMDAAVKSLVFDNKNIETFPDALFMTGRCYEDLLEWYRARDVYYEIARLFPATSHATTAREKLKYLMDKGVTKEKESSPVEAVFFGLDEDVNAKVQTLLNGKDEQAEDSTEEDLQKDADEEVVAAEKKDKTKKEGADPQ